MNLRGSVEFNEGSHTCSIVLRCYGRIAVGRCWAVRRQHPLLHKSRILRLGQLLTIGRPES